MPALDFPSSPTNGQTYGNYIYDSSITAWRNVNSETGIVALNGMGLRTVVPTSVTTTGGAVTVNANGLVTFSGTVSKIILNGVFTGTYSNYRVLVKIGQQDISSYLQMRFATGGTENTSASYGFNGTQQIGAGTVSGFYSSGVTSALLGNGAGDTTVSLDIFNPYVAARTRYNATCGGYNAALGSWTTNGLFDNTSLLFDGLSFYPGTGSFSGTGTIQVYGYTN